jgi:hypothetical protein
MVRLGFLAALLCLAAVALSQPSLGSMTPPWQSSSKPSVTVTYYTGNDCTGSKISEIFPDAIENAYDECFEVVRVSKSGAYSAIAAWYTKDNNGNTVLLLQDSSEGVEDSHLTPSCNGSMLFPTIFTSGCQNLYDGTSGWDSPPTKCTGDASTLKYCSADYEVKDWVGVSAASHLQLTFMFSALVMVISMILLQF